MVKKLKGLPGSTPHIFKWAVPPVLRSEEARHFMMPILMQRTWQTSKHRILVVFGTADSEDIRNRTMLDGPSANVLQAIRDIGKDYAAHLHPESYSLSVACFNYFRTVHLTGEHWDIAQREATRRIQAIIQRLQPHTVFIIGAQPAEYILNLPPDEVFLNQGRIRTIDGVNYVTTVDVASSYQGKSQGDDEDEDDEAKVGLANLIGFMGRCFGNAIAKRSVYRVDPNFKVVPKVIDTIEEFRRFLAFLLKQDRVAVDTETLNLYRKKNKLLTIQFGFTGSKGFMIPIGHMDAPWTDEEKREIWMGLRKFFTRKFDYLKDNSNCFLLGQNLKFDATVIRETFKINTLEWPLIDLMALAYLCDENMAANRMGNKGRSGKKGYGSYGLLWQTKWFDCDFYTTNAFGKDDRFNIANLPLSTPGLVEYTVADVQLPWHLLALYRQWMRNRKLMVLGKPYHQVWWKFAATQMSSMIHIISHMEHRGDPLDTEWLKTLMRRDGPLATALREKTEEFRKFASVKAVNKRLLAEKGKPVDDMFGDAVWEFSITKPSHKQALFIEEMGLEPLMVSRKTGQPVLDKKFQDQYKDRPEVALFSELSQIMKLAGTYVKGFHKILKTSADMMHDLCLRASFGFTLSTGRSNSYDPF